MKHREITKLVKAAEKAGCTARRGGSGHWVITTPSGTVISISASPSDWRYLKNALADLKRAGVDLDD